MYGVDCGLFRLQTALLLQAVHVFHGKSTGFPNGFLSVVYAVDNLISDFRLTKYCPKP